MDTVYTWQCMKTNNGGQHSWHMTDSTIRLKQPKNIPF